MADYRTFIDTVKVEKANAVARYQNFRNLAKLLHFLQFVFLLTVLSWSSSRIPDAFSTLKISGKYVVECLTYALNPHVVFLIGNAIVLALYVLSRHIDVENNSAASVLYENFETTENRSSINMIEAVEAPKQIVCKEISKVTNEKDCEVVQKAPVIQLKKLNRAMSEKLQQARPRKQFRRSETEVRRVRQMSRNLSKFETVDTLSNEDFRLTVEAFIAKQQNFLREQRMAELTV